MQPTRISAYRAVSLTLWSALAGMGVTGDLRAEEAVAKANAFRPGTRADVGQATSRANAATLAVGDRVKIAFHEMVDVPGGGPSSRSGPGTDFVLHTFLQRTDLSAEYLIDEDGIIALPRLGKFQVTGLGLGDLEVLLTYAFAHATKHPAEVNVSILDRRPVYVVGAVKNAGAFKHVGQMSVLQAVALAGGIDRGGCNTAELIEAVREQERVSKLSRQLERLLARKARLEAERQGSTSMQAPAQLIALAGNEATEEMLSAEKTLLKLDQVRRAQERAETGAVADTTRKEIEAMRAKLLQLNAQRQMHGDYLNDLRRVDGMATRMNVIKVRNDLADIEARRQDIHVALATAEARLAQTERTVARFDSDHAAELAKSIATTEAEISEVRLTLTSAGLLAAALGEVSTLNAASPRGAHPPIYEIVRQGRDGPAVLPAQEHTQLLPDDVLKVRSSTTSQSERASTVTTMSVIGRTVSP